MKPNLLFLTLKVFSATGGIEKVSRLAGKAFFEHCENSDFNLTIYSAYDGSGDIERKYFPEKVFKGFGGQRIGFVLQSLLRGRRASVVIMSHINLLPVGYAIKIFSPSTRLVLFAHGIEVWPVLPAWQRHLLKACDLILAVSWFTRNRMLHQHNLSPQKLQVVNNCIDPFLPPPQEEKSPGLLQRYGLRVEDKVLLTLTRLSSREGYKGYDEVLMAVKSLKENYPGLRYLVAGKYDSDEKGRLDRLIQQQGLEQSVVFAGFVPEEELAAHFALADIFIMPSRKEGFGIAFIEALHYGKPVIAGNKDGSVDALAGGQLGWLVNPSRPEEIKGAITEILRLGADAAPDGDEVQSRFAYPVYREKLWAALEPYLTVGVIKRNRTKEGVAETAPAPFARDPGPIPE